MSAYRAGVKKTPGRNFFRGGQTRRGGGMNKTEEAYSRILTARQHAGEIEWFRHEGIKLRVTDQVGAGLKATWYTPDFIVMLPGGDLELHEVKGGLELKQDILRLKAAASHYPFRFVLARKVSKAKGEWDILQIQ